MTEALDWKFQQAFGDKAHAEEITDADIISAIDFDETGNFVATGDKGGHIHIYERVYDKAAGAARRPALQKPQQQVEYRLLTEFQSHEPEFDYLKSLEIEEKINKVRFCKRQNGSLTLLSTNDKTIKLWKVQEKRMRTIYATNLEGKSFGRGAVPAGRTLRVPRIVPGESVISAVPRRVYPNAHAYHINSICLNSDGETYISADDLRVNLWNLEINDQSFNVVDIKPPNMEELTEVITAAEFHPQHCNIFMYSSSKGSIRLVDMRDAALCDRHAKLFEEEEDPSNKSFFSEIISSISDVKFSLDGRYILARDFMTLKIWDINMEARPLKTIHIHEQLRPKLCDLYENDCIFDKFECAFSHDGNHVMTGSYHNMFHVYDRWGRTDTSIEASKNPPKKKPPTGLQRAGSKLGITRGPGKPAKKDEINVDTIDFGKKVLHTAWHPQQNLVAVAALNNLFVYSV